MQNPLPLSAASSLVPRRKVQDLKNRADPPIRALPNLQIVGWDFPAGTFSRPAGNAQHSRVTTPFAM